MTIHVKTSVDALEKIFNPMCEFGEDFLMHVTGDKLRCAAIDGGQAAFLVVRAPVEMLGTQEDGAQDVDYFLDVKKIKAALKALKGHGEVSGTITQSMFSLKSKRTKINIPNLRELVFKGGALKRVDPAKYGLDSHVMVQAESLNTAIATMRAVVHDGKDDGTITLTFDDKGARMYANLDGRDFEEELDPWVGPEGSSVTTSVLLGALAHTVSSVPEGVIHKVEMSTVNNGDFPVVFSSQLGGVEYLCIVAPLVKVD